MGREDLERLSKPELVELVLKLQRPAQTSRTSSKPPSRDRKERREQSRPGGAKPGHDGHKRVLAADPDMVIDHRPTGCPDCGLTLPADLPAEVVSVHEEIDIPPEPYAYAEGRGNGACGFRSAVIAGRGGLCQAAASRPGVSAGIGRQFHGSSSVSRWAGWDAMRPSTSASQA